MSPFVVMGAGCGASPALALQRAQIHPEPSLPGAGAQLCLRLEWDQARCDLHTLAQEKKSSEWNCCCHLCLLLMRQPWVTQMSASAPAQVRGKSGNMSSQITFRCQYLP